MTFVLPSFGSSVISAAPASGGGASFSQYSVSMDGSNDYMDAGPISAIQNASAFSFSVWFKAGASGEYPAFGGFSSGTDMVSAYGYLNDLVLSVRGGHETRYEVDSSVLPTDTTSFHHYVYTFSSGTFKVYVDGVEKSGTVINAGTTSTGSAGFDFLIGAQGFHYDYGLYDEFAVFNSALSASNVTTIYNSGIPNDISSLSPTNWWRMGDNDGGTGTTITDQGSGGNDGTLTNGPTFSTDVPS